ncbi:MAG: hypothetical protein AAGN66_02290 [Acidobacteriota bacterium]
MMLLLLDLDLLARGLRRVRSPDRLAAGFPAASFAFGVVLGSSSRSLLSVMISVDAKIHFKTVASLLISLKQLILLTL